MDLKKVKAIIDLVKRSGIAELEITEGEDKLKITAMSRNPSSSGTSTHVHQQDTFIHHQPHTGTTSQNSHPGGLTTGTTAQYSEPANAAPPPREEIDVKQITSPMVGTFYSSPSPSAAAFIAIGQEVKVGQTLCIIEAMKLMNQIVSDQAGIIKEILVADGDPIEFGQPLFIIV